VKKGLESKNFFDFFDLAVKNSSKTWWFPEHEGKRRRPDIRYGGIAGITGAWYNVNMIREASESGASGGKAGTGK
jgi:hypothetical protein